MQRAAEDFLERTRAYGWTGPPFDPIIAASLHDIKDRASSAIQQDALLRPVDHGKRFEIVWNDRAPVTRRNFTIAHEIAHTFFPDCAEHVRYRGEAHVCDRDKPLEILCDIGAAEILLPLPEFRDDVHAQGVSLDTLEVLRARYVASREAVARRMVDLNVGPCAAAFLSWRLSLVEQRSMAQLTLPGVAGPQRKLRIDMMFVSDSFGAERLPKHKSIPDDSCAYEVLDEQSTGVVAVAARRVEQWSSGRGLLPPCEIAAMSIPPNGNGDPRVLALLHRA